MVSITARRMATEDQDALDQRTMDIRRAARQLLESRLVHAGERTTGILACSTGRRFSIRALASGPGRVVGWLAASSDEDTREVRP